MKLLLVSSTASMLIQEIQLKGIITIVCTLYLGSNTFCRKKQLVQHSSGTASNPWSYTLGYNTITYVV